MEANQDAILYQTLSCLHPHAHPQWGDREPMDVFNRLLAKNIKRNDRADNTHCNIQPSQIRSHREKWAIGELDKLTLWHSGTGGRDFDCPIIVAEYLGSRLLLDGNHRINRWRENRDARLHDVNIHTVDGIAQFLEIPGVV